MILVMEPIHMRMETGRKKGSELLKGLDKKLKKKYVGYSIVTILMLMLLLFILWNEEFKINGMFMILIFTFLAYIFSLIRMIRKDSKKSKNDG